MATISLAEAASFAPPDPNCRIVFGNRVTDQLFGKVPFVYVDGHEIRVPFVDAEQLRNYATVIGTTGATPDSSWPPLSEGTTQLSHLAAILEVDSQIVAHYGNKRDILRALVDVKVAAVLELFRYLLVNGDSSITGQPNGLLKLAAGLGNVVGATGAVQAGHVEDMLSLVRPQHGFVNRYLVMHSQALKHIRAGAYQNEVNFIVDPALGPLSTVCGVPVLIDDYLPLDQGPSSNWTSIVGVVLEPETGFFGVLPCRQRGREIRVTGPVLQEGTDREHYGVVMTATCAASDPGSLAVLNEVEHAL